MRASFTRVFQNNPELLAEMLSLWLGGWQERTLATRYNVDRTTIRNWYVKYDIRPKMPRIVIVPWSVKKTTPSMTVVILPTEPSRFKYQELFDEEDAVNPGKSYKEYIQEHQKRDQSFKFKINPYMPNPEIFL